MKLPSLEGDRDRAALLAVVCFVAYAPALFAGFIWDDDNLLTANAALDREDALFAIFFEPRATGQYYPLVFASFWLEKQLWGLNPLGYHVVNIALHVAAALLAWRALRHIIGPAGYAAAMLFALHPVHVESVAWVSERKNVLSGALYLAAACVLLPLYLDEERRTSGRRAALGAGLFVAALLAKTVTASLPAALLVVQWAKRGRLTWRGVGLSSALAVPGVLLGLVTVHYEEQVVGSAPDAWLKGPIEKLVVAGTAPWFYLSKLLFPTGLSFSYTRWDLDVGAWRVVFPILTVAVLATLVVVARRGVRAPLAAVLFFGGTLVPALGFISVYPMRYSFVADHFQYLASLGPLALLALLWRRLVERDARARHAGALVVAILASLTFSRALVFRDAEALWVDALEENPRCFICLTHLGSIYDKGGDRAAAMAAWRAALEADRGAGEAAYNLGLRLIAERPDEALALMEHAHAVLPHSPSAAMDLAKLHARSGRFDRAEAVLMETEALRPEHQELKSLLERVRAARARPVEP